ncbi:calcium-activated chloride channel regulator 2-like [Dermacentor silvarum]|uniref:calcium-activated chloride channel regulator 2-like n=1 Tax=Dermacentor silvarum TaxID=543639 RepID=UPI00210160BD|nr:calcium-activated chloride channel regulator 2-like [Dermacentor silvarum]
MHLPAEYLLNLSPLTAEKKESSAYTFVHEWAHLRYGVFDEYGRRGDPEYPETYCEGRKLKLNACSKILVFTAARHDGSACSKDNECNFEKNCIISPFIPAEHPAESSIMFMPYVKNISHFCESGQGLRMHNYEARTTQNVMCKRKSASDVILSNDDFKKLAAPNLSKRIHVTFEEAQRGDQPQKVVVALDTSSSMKTNDRINFLKEGLQAYIKNIPDGKIRLAILEFSNNATLLHNVLLVNSTTRQRFVATVNALKADRRTCIGCALKLAIQVLNKPNDPPHGSIVMLVTDGAENAKPYLRSMIPSLVNSLVEVSTFALGTAADPKLEELAAATNGRVFYFPNSQKFAAVRMEVALQTASTPGMVDSAWPIMVLHDEKNFTNQISVEFPIDIGLTKKATVLTRARPEQNIRTWLIDPHGKNCTSCRTVVISHVVNITIPDPAPPGIWTLRVKSTNNDPMDISVRVMAQPEDNTEPIITTCKMTSMEPGHKSTFAVIVDVTKGKQIVLKARVVAYVTDPHGRMTTLTLHDNGEVPDVYPDDGKYSGYFIEFTGKGRYAVKARVNGNETRKSCCATCSGSAITPRRLLTLPSGRCKLSGEYDISCFPTSNESFRAAPPPPGEPIGPFQREVDGGSVIVPYDLEKHMVPPVTVRNLKVSNAVPGKNGTLLANLTWTWPGKHMTHGTASSIDIRASKDFKSLDDHFESQVQIDSTSLVQGDLIPRPGGTTNVVTISLTPELAEERENFTMWRVKFALRVNNSYGLMSGISNIAQLAYDDWSKTEGIYHGKKYTPKVPEGLPARPTTAGKSSPKSTQDNSAEDESDDGTSSTSLIPWLLALLVAAVVVGSAVLWILKRSKGGSDSLVGEKGVAELAETTSAPP